MPEGLDSWGLSDTRVADGIGEVAQQDPPQPGLGLAIVRRDRLRLEGLEQRLLHDVRSIELGLKGFLQEGGFGAFGEDASHVY